ncbi:MAG: HNH endonuclease, partial [Planctomycetota bacterium]
MPAVPPLKLVNAILDAIDQSGEVGILTSGIKTHPRKFAVSGPAGATELWAYAWTLTFGGRPALPNELRIQMTSVASPLLLNPDGLTVLIGYEPSLRTFGGFDLERHKRFTTGSPSVQIANTALQQALQNGLAFHRKENNEIAVAIRPDQFMTYARNATKLHAYGRDRSTLKALSKASSLQPIESVDIERLGTDRQRVVETVSRMSRAANFREQVLNGYGHRCAVSRMQLRLVDAAHILPVAAPGSADHIVNGIALSASYHRAFDNGLIYLDEQYVMRSNPEKEQTLTEL